MVFRRRLPHPWVRRRRGIRKTPATRSTASSRNRSFPVGRALHFALAFLLAASTAAAARRVLYVTTTAGYRHDSIDASVEVMQDIAKQSGILEIVHTENVSLINAETLRGFDALYFFTSGEL